MRIAFIAHLSEISGAGTALVAVAAGFQQAGHEVRLLLPGSGPLQEYARRAGVEPIIQENPEQAFSGGVGRRLSLAKARLQYINRVRRYMTHERIDVAYVNSSASVFAGLGAAAAQRTIVWHIHETVENPGRGMRLKLSAIRRLAHGLVYASMSAVRGAEPGNLPWMVARNAIGFHALHVVRQCRRARHVQAGAASAPMIFGNGTIRRKGADVLLRAVELLRKDHPHLQPTVTVTGPETTQPEYYSELQQLAQEDALRGSVRFAGIQPSLLPFLEAADVYVSASRNEAMPIAIVEAMAAGVPVISTDVGDCAELLDRGKCGWVVPPDDAHALAAALAEALTNPAEARQRAEAAAAKADALYNPEGFWDELISFVDRVRSERG